MKHKKNFTLLFIAMAFCSNAQDSLSLKKKVERPREIGFSASSVFFFLAGVSDPNERYTNITYRYFFKERQAIKLFTGASLFNNEGNKYEQSKLMSANQTTLYATREKKTPSNFQLGIGYEYILGNGKLKHVLGADILYNNKFVSDKSYYISVRDSIDGNGHSTLHTTRLDSGAVTKTNNYDKFGLNLNYSLRYRISKKWVITAGLLVSYKTYKSKTPYGHTRVGETNFNGIISDVSVFYKF